MNDTDPFEIVEYNNLKHREQVVALWKDIFGYETARNDPGFAIDKKIAMADGLFFVAVHQEEVVGTVMAGYDGHRGWIYSMAVHPGHRQKGIASALLVHAERRLAFLGCVKINLQILKGNEDVQRFYRANGYTLEDRISMGKQLDENVSDTGVQHGKPSQNRDHRRV
jgi:ribosomal protein S18 acetylase RimI-like enzyme